MKLSPNEIRDITNLLEAGKPLPEKYRFVLFGDKRNLELVWDGKTNAITDIQLPFQVIEQIDEPRSESLVKSQMGLFDQTSGRQIKGWSNKLIWGDNKFILSSLKSGSLRDEIESKINVLVESDDRTKLDKLRQEITQITLEEKNKLFK